MDLKELENKYPLLSEVVYKDELDKYLSKGGNRFFAKLKPRRSFLKPFYKLTSPLMDMLEVLLEKPEDIVFTSEKEERCEFRSWQFSHSPSGLVIKYRDGNSKYGTACYPDFVMYKFERDTINLVLDVAWVPKPVLSSREKYTKVFCKES